MKHLRFIWTSEENSWYRRLAWAPFDFRSLTGLLALGLISLRYLSIMGYHNYVNAPLFCQSPAQLRICPSVRSLQQMSFDDRVGVMHILLHLLSLFSVHTLAIRNDPLILRGSEPEPISPPLIHRSIPLTSVVVRDLVLGMTRGFEECYKFFELVLTPGSLRALGIWARGEQELIELERFLRSQAAQDLRSISIDTSLVRFQVGYSHCAYAVQCI